ncbi:MAG: HAMP domain-containing sensor histidine kinase [Bacteroidota bacterium]
MKGKWLLVLIVLGSLAMLGIIFVQLSWIRNALKISQESFNTSVNNALVKTVDKLEKKEDVIFITDKFNLKLDTGLPYQNSSAATLSQKEKNKAIDNEVVIKKSDPELHERIVTNHEITSSALTESSSNNDRKILMTETDRFAKRINKMNDVIREIVVEAQNKNLNIENRLDTFSLQKELNKALLDNGIHLPYEFAVIPAGKAAPLNLRSRNFADEYRNKSFKVSLFPNDLIAKSNYLLVYFPNQKNELVKSMSWLMTLSLIFTFTLLVVFVMTILAVFKQKKISEIKTDFINNMTHEFKTPLATISLAVDSINNAKVIEDPALIRNYTQVIREENKRMNAHVEQVLQMALFDRHEFSFDLARLEMNLLLKKAVGSIRLQVEKNQGSISLELNATKDTVLGDQVHLLNCILNLLDNANKYSPEKPEILVYTINRDKMIVIGISDKGIGMSKETQKRIFEKFYRIPTGNIHNVKGFGLGLSYAKAIIDGHHGSISVWSETGSGTRIEIVLPLPKEDRKSVIHES